MDLSKKGPFATTRSESSTKPEYSAVRLERREGIAAYTLLLPSFVPFVIFIALPMIMAVGLSFYRWSPFAPPRFVGLENWVRLASEGVQLTAITNTIAIVGFGIPISMAIGLGLALLLDDLPFGKVIFRSVFFAPATTSLVAISIVWRNLYQYDTGLLNYIISLVGMDPVRWLGTNALLAVTILYIWHTSGFHMLLFLAGLQTINPSLIDAARVDGAGAIDVLRHVTLPGLTPVIFFILITSTISGLQAFELVYLLTAGGPGDRTTTIVYYIVQTAFRRSDLGMASVMSIVLFVLIAIPTFIQWKFQDRWVSYEMG